MTIREYPKARVTKVHDGDTIYCDVDMGFDIWANNQRFRLLGLNAPELETDAGKASQAYLAGLIPVGTVVTLHVSQVKDHDEREKYGRWLAQVWLDTRNLNQLLVDNGFAKAWDGKGPRPV